MTFITPKIESFSLSSIFFSKRNNELFLLLITKERIPIYISLYVLPSLLEIHFVCFPILYSLFFCVIVCAFLLFLLDRICFFFPLPCDLNMCAYWFCAKTNKWYAFIWIKKINKSRRK